MSPSVGKRKEKRIEAVHPIRLWGMDSNGRPFVEAVTTLDVSRTGARLKNPKARIALGDIVGLKSGECKSRFQVVWVGKAGTPDAGHIGLKSVEAEPGLWNMKPRGDQQEVDTYTRPPLRNNRLVRRLNCSLSAEVGSNRSAGRTRTFITDIGLGGCYISMISPYKAESKLTLGIWLDERTKTWLDGIVISCHPGMGMGIKFLNLSRRTIEELNWLLGQLEAPKAARALTTNV